MCGIVGIASSYLNQMDVARFRELLLVSGLRGMDSTGVISIRRQEDKGKQQIKVSYRKKAIDPVGFMFEKESQKLWAGDPPVRALIGHTRLATQGEVKIENAHPFTFPNVIGVHNGTISYKFGDSGNFETDSQALYSLINEKGIDAALQEVEDSGWDGAYALVFYNHKEKTLNFIRNIKRPLWLAWNESANNLYFASEIGMIDLVIGRSNTRLARTGSFMPTQPLVHELWSLDMTQSSVSNLKRRRIDIKTKVSHSWHYHGQSYKNIEDWRTAQKKDEEVSKAGASCDVPALEKPFSPEQARAAAEKSISEGSATGGKEATEAGKEASTPFSATPPPWVNSKQNKGGALSTHVHKSLGSSEIGGIKFFKGWAGREFSEKKMLDKLRSGCAWCQAQLELHDLPDVKWFDEDTFLCDDCQRDIDVSSFFGFTPGQGLYT